ncbi:MAG: hypothetical protein CL557_17920 [Alphaproteobacteria bacterium]|nr:hypothetical protein [Alphaproteobacteria bacterium]
MRLKQMNLLEWMRRLLVIHSRNEMRFQSHRKLLEISFQHWWVELHLLPILIYKQMRSINLILVVR